MENPNISDRISLRQLEYIVAIAETGRFSRAAELCRVSQPALSMQLQAAEKALGLRLFERSRRGVIPSPGARELLSEARSILSATQRFVDRARALQDPFAGALVLGVIPTIAPYMLPAALRGLAQDQARLELRLREDRTPDLIAALNAGQVDGALLAWVPGLEAFDAEDIAVDDFLFATWLGNPRLRGKKSISLAALEGERLLVLEDGHCLGDQARSFCSLRAPQAQLDARASSLSTLMQMVALRLGSTLLPKLCQGLEVTTGRGIVVRPLRDRPRPQRRIVLAWRAGCPRRPVWKWLAQRLRGALIGPKS